MSILTNRNGMCTVNLDEHRHFINFLILCLQLHVALSHHTGNKDPIAVFICKVIRSHNSPGKGQNPYKLSMQETEQNQQGHRSGVTNNNDLYSCV